MLARNYRPRRARLVTGLIVVCFMAAAPAQAATTIGETGNTGSSCTQNITIHQQVSAPGSPSYVVPAGGGVITSWSYDAPATADQIKFKAIRPAGANQFTVVGDTQAHTMTPNTVNSVPARIPVQGGDTIAINVVNNGAGCAHDSPAQPGDQIDGCVACDPAQGTTYTTMAIANNARINAAATVEPDADGDSFGDETQDQCRTDPSTQATCPVPTISGTAQAGAQLTATPGGQPNNPSFQWLRCDAGGANCSPIPGATGTSYTPTGPDVGSTLRFRKTATNSSGSQTTESAPTSQVAANATPCSTPFTGTTGNDTLTGTAGGDTIFGLAGNDVLSGLAGPDCLDGSSENDRLSGGSEADRLSAGSGRDRLSGDAGADRLSGAAGNDRASGGSGNDRASGGGGRDRIAGGGGRDRLSGAAGNDRISGDAGNDRISGGGGRDRLAAGGGRNRLSGGSGNDLLNIANGRRDVANCGGGRDTVRADRRDRVRNCERVIRT
jgi:Ca2+-binding RTX toxin-like protein